MNEKDPTLHTIRKARARADKRARIEARADRVRYDEQNGMIVLDLRGGAIVALPVAAIHELRRARPNQLKGVRAAFNGESITVDELDLDVSIPGLLRDLIGITSAAALLGRKGGAVKSKTKAAAVRENGKRGGRPRSISKPA